MNNLKAARKAKGMTQAEVAKAIGLTQNGYSYWENGKTKIDKDQLIKLATLFDVSTDYLLGREQRVEPPTEAGEGQLDERLIRCLCELTTEELGKVDAFVQGMIASRRVETNNDC